MSPGDTRELLTAEIAHQAELARLHREIDRLEDAVQRQRDWRRLTWLLAAGLLVAIGGLWAIADQWFDAQHRIEQLERVESPAGQR